jgi:hypothetical protein
MLGDVGCRAAVLAAEREALQQPQRDEQHRRSPADRRVRRQQADEECRAAHHDDRDQERVLAADEIADPAEDDRAERPDQEARCVRRERRKQRCGLVTLREEQRREERRERRVQVEVVPLEYGAER